MRNKFRSEKLTRGINPILLDKELVARMCLKSKLLFGSKWRWRVMCSRNNVDPVELEIRFDIVIERSTKQVKESQVNEQSSSNQQLGSDAGRDNNGESRDSAEVKSARDTKGQEVRSGQTDDEPITTGGIE
jgi:hypothetical protein